MLQSYSSDHLAAGNQAALAYLELRNRCNPAGSKFQHKQTAWRQKTVLVLTEIMLKNLLLSGLTIRASATESTSG